MLHLLDGLVEGDDVGDLEECRLHDSIGARTESEVGRDLGGVDDVELDVVTRHVRLHVVGQRSARRSGVVHRVEQERTALFEAFQHVVLVDIRRHVAGHEIGRGNKIGRRNGVVAEAQVRRGVTARLLRVVREVCLTVLVGRTADYLDRVLVGTHRSVGAQTEEESLERTALGHRYLCADGDRVHRNVVDDTNREVVLGLGGGEIVVHGQHLCRRGVLRRETVASADNHRAIVRLVEYVLDVEQERLAIGTRLLGAVEYADALDRRGQHFEQILRREGAVEVYGNDTHLATLSRQVVDALLDSLGNRAHSDDYMLGILGTVIGKGLVGASRDARNLGHSLGHHVEHGVVELVGSLARLEIYVGVLSRTARNGVLGVESTLAECLQGIAVEHRRERRLVDKLDLLYLVRGAESVEEVYERNARTQCDDMRHAGKVHDLLHRRGGQHGEAGLTHGHDILMIAEDRQRLCRQRTRRNVEHAGQQLARNLVHVGNHQQQTLRRGKGRGQSTALQRAVHGARGTRLRLHLDDLDRIAENILAPLRRPLVDQLGHCRRRRDGIYGRYLREHISYMSRSIVAVTCNKLLFCHFV